MMKNKFKLRDLLVEAMSAKQRNTPSSSRPQAAQNVLQQIQDLNRRGIKTDATSLAGAGIDYGQITRAMAAAQDPSTAFDRKNSSKGGNGGSITLKDTEKKKEEQPTSAIFTTDNVKVKKQKPKPKPQFGAGIDQEPTPKPQPQQKPKPKAHFGAGIYQEPKPKPQPQPKPKPQEAPKPQPQPQEAPKPQPQKSTAEEKAERARRAAEKARKKYYNNQRSERIRRVTGAISTASNLAKAADPSQMPREL